MTNLTALFCTIGLRAGGQSISSVNTVRHSWWWGWFNTTQELLLSGTAPVCLLTVYLT